MTCRTEAMGLYTTEKPSSSGPWLVGRTAPAYQSRRSSAAFSLGRFAVIPATPDDLRQAGHCGGYGRDIADEVDVGEHLLHDAFLSLGSDRAGRHR